MSINIKKKTIKIIAIIIMAIILIIGAFFAINIISDNIVIKQTEEKLNQINAEELESKIIKELNESELAINSVGYNVDDDVTPTKTIFEEGKKFKGYISANINGYDKNEKEIVDKIEIPCFKIKSDNNGNFINIEYNKNFKKIIEKVFKENYNIDLFIIGDQKHCKRFNEEVSGRGFTNKGSIYYSSDIYFEEIYFLVGNCRVLYEKMGEGTNLSNDLTKEYETTTFGLEF